jgi:hypothetical protein
VHDSLPGGNNNGRLDPGESGHLVLTMRNAGNQPANNISVKMRSLDARLVIADSAAGFGTIPAGAYGSNDVHPFSVSADPDIPLETRMPCRLFVTGDNYCDTLNFSLAIGEIRAMDPIPDGPRTPPRFWAYDDGDLSYPEHPTFDWVETRGRGTQIVLDDDQTAPIALPSGFVWDYYGQSYTGISVCSNGWVAPGTVTNIDYYNYPLPYSGMPGFVPVCWADMYPPDGGGVWYFHDVANHRFVVEWDSVCYFPSGSGLYDKFQLVLYDTTVTTPTGDNVFIAQYLTANNYGSNSVGMQDPTATIAIQCLYDGAYHRGTSPVTANRAIKYSTVLPLTGITEVPHSSRPSFSPILASPNPFRNKVNFALPAGLPVTALSIYDNTGRLVRSLPIPQPPTPNTQHLTWDARNATGARVAPGIYFYRATTNTRELTGKLILTR